MFILLKCFHPETHEKKISLNFSKKKICRDFCVVFFQISLDFIQEKKLNRIFFLFCNFILKFFVFFLLDFTLKMIPLEVFSGNNSAKKKFLFHLKKHYLDFFPPQKRENVEHL